jgi:hypothetical protein
LERHPKKNKRTRTELMALCQAKIYKDKEEIKGIYFGLACH